MSEQYNSLCALRGGMERDWRSNRPLQDDVIIGAMQAIDRLATLELDKSLGRSAPFMRPEYESHPDYQRMQWLFEQTRDWDEVTLIIGKQVVGTGRNIRDVVDAAITRKEQP